MLFSVTVCGVHTKGEKGKLLFLVPQCSVPSLPSRTFLFFLPQTPDFCCIPCSTDNKTSSVMDEEENRQLSFGLWFSVRLSSEKAGLAPVPNVSPLTALLRSNIRKEVTVMYIAIQK
ncbi:hypothetical protein ILYODFUR_024464 [Ilyodon furcidens]|uniref:Uncharacterized protein n=1 Tax=Ilyodon furcidens TaxID=33524 RepID=A0ABV0U9Z0_9TELE